MIVPTNLNTFLEGVKRWALPALIHQRFQLSKVVCIQGSSTQVISIHYIHI